MSLTRINPTGRVETVPVSDGSVTLHVPIRMTRRSGRKLVRLPPGAEEKAQTRRPWDPAPTPLQRALGRAERWRRMLESGEAASISEIARREKTDFSYVARLLNLTTLAPDIIEAILTDTLPEGTALNDLAINPPLQWEEQRQRLT